MLNKVPNNNDIISIENKVLNKAPNCNDATCIVSNVHLTTMGAEQFSVVAI